MAELFLAALGITAGLVLAAAIILVLAIKFWSQEALRLAWARLNGGVPRLPAKYARKLGGLGTKDGQHFCAFVSRHHLAESGIDCPLCKWKVAEAGDFSKVFVVTFEGRDNECLICPGEREVEDGKPVPCEAVLLASPDTEHGDHFNDQGEVDPYAVDPPSYFKFVRGRPDQALINKWGVDVKAEDGDNGIVLVPENPAERSKSLATAETAELPAVSSKTAKTNIMPAATPLAEYRSLVQQLAELRETPGFSPKDERALTDRITALCAQLSHEDLVKGTL